MRSHRKRGLGRMRLALLGASILAGGVSSAALAQTKPQATAGKAPEVTEVVVTGVRKSLTDAAVAKENSANFTDSIFAEDVAKFPDLNIAESLVRVPGVQLTRDIDGSGVQISVRGLGPSFTKILLNGSQIAVASDGGTDAGNSNREVDLDMFPTELFTKLTVNKTPLAELLEGGVSGTVNLVNARAFDRPGPHLTYSLEGGYGDSSQKFSPRGAIIASDTWGAWGGLIAFAGSDTKYRTDGFESIGWTTPNLSAAQCGLASCNNTGGKGFSFPATVPATAGNGLTAGTPIDAAFLAAHNPGTSLLQLGNALMPRLGRDSFSAGTKQHESALVSLEYRPSDKFHAAVDMLFGHSDRSFNRIDMDWSVRNSNFMVPLNVTTDAHNVVTAGTFANAQFFLEARPYHETVDFVNFNPSLTYHFNDWIQVDGQVNVNRSRFFREAPSFLFNSPQGVTVQYTNNGGVVPTISPSADLNNPNLGWTFNRLNIQNVKRVTSDKGTHWDATFGDSKVNIRAGVAYDDTKREIVAYDGSSAYQNCVFNGASSVINGKAITCPAGSTIANSALPQFLIANGPGGDFFHVGSGNPGYTHFIGVDYGKIKAASNYAFFNSQAAFSTSSATATPSGNIEEKTTGGYVEVNGVGQFLDREVTYNAGIRYVSTKQTVQQLVSINGAFISDTLEHDYDAYLPSFNVAARLMDQVILRVAGSRTMTRPNPNQLLPGVTFSDPSAQVANQGNPNLAPFFSDNADVGLEWYTGGPGYVSVNLFQKTVTGFTVNQQVSEPFSALGIPLSALAPVQLATGITNDTIIAVNTQVNLGTSYIKGVEVIWVQPLDRFVKGLGITANYTHLDTKAPTTPGATTTGPLPGVPKFTYNLGAYYENHNISVHLTYVYNDKLITATAPQNNVNQPLVADARGQMDLSASYTLPNWIGQQTQVTFNATNLTNEPIKTVFGFPNAPYTTYFPGRQFLIGLRGKF